MNLYIYFFCFIILTASCKTPSFVKIKEICYHTGTAVLWRNSGTFFNQANHTEYIYFADVMQEKKLMLFTLNGTLDKEISLKKALDWHNVSGVIVKSLDTIIILDHYSLNSHRITFTDSSGYCWRKIIIQQTENNDIFQYRHSPFGNSLCDHSLILTSIWFKDKNEPQADGSPETMQPYYLNLYKSPCVLLFDFHTLKHQFALDTMWRIFCSDTSLFFGTNIYNTYENNNLFLYTNISNKIYVSDIINFNIKDTIRINSKYTKIGINPYPMKEYEKFLQDYLVSGKILNILYDKYTRLYYIITWHEASKDQIPFFSERPFSIHIYNHRFKKLNEHYFEGNKYDPRDCIVTKEGLLIKHNDNNKSYNPTTIKYDLYEIKK